MLATGELLANQSQKYTQGSTGVWETIRKAFAVDPNRSNGIPVKQYRNPPPGGNDPTQYDDPVTVPAGDIADNPYWRRDVRRSYPKLSTISQSDAVGLLTMGNATNPSPKLLAGEEGTKQLVLMKQEGSKGLSNYFETEKGTAVLGEGGLPPMPVATGSKLVAAEKYAIGTDQAYNDQVDQYPCRSFV